MTLNSKYRTDRKRRKQKDETLIFQKKKKKKKTGKKCRLINPFEQNNDHTRIMYKIQFCGSFKTFIY